MRYDRTSEPVRLHQVIRMRQIIPGVVCKSQEPTQQVLLSC